MGGGKQTPRQKLIGMMYLFLTAMLALNVSTNVLLSFLVVNDSMVATNRNFEVKVQSVYDVFERALAENREKVQPNFDKALEARRLTEELRQFIRLTKGELIAMASGLPLEDAMNLSPHDIRRQDDYDTPSRFFINDGRGTELRERIVRHVEAMYALLPEESRAKIISPFNVKGPFFDAGGTEISWERANFGRAIIVAAITILNKLENDAMNLEFDVVNELFRLVSAGDLTFDNVQARIVPKSTFVALGGQFEAEIFLVAFDSRTRLIGNVNGQIIHSRDGVIHYTASATREGTFPVSGFIDLPGGERYPFRTEYVVAAPTASVSADKMNVFYIGVDNPISLAVSGVDPSNVSARISGNNNTITRNPSGPGYIVRVSSTGNVNVTLSVRDGNITKDAGSFLFRVKRVPPPIAIVAGTDEHTTSIDRDVLASRGGLVPRMPEFDFDLPGLRVTSFTMSTTAAGGDIQTFRSESNRFTEQMLTVIRNARRGQRIFFENIIVQMPTGPTELRSIVLTIN